MEILDDYKITEIDVDLAKNYMEENKKKNDVCITNFDLNFNTDTNNDNNDVEEGVKSKNNQQNINFDELDNEGMEMKSVAINNKDTIKDRKNEKTHIEVKGKVIDKIDYIKKEKSTNNTQNTNINPKTIITSKVSVTDLQNKLKQAEEKNKLHKAKIETLEIQLENLINLNKELEREKQTII